MAKNEAPNVKALVQFRKNGEVIVEGEVVDKASFKQKSDWQNLLHMNPPRVEETTEAVGKPKATKATKPAAPAATTAAMPGATK